MHIIEPFSPTEEIRAGGHYDQIAPYSVDVDGMGVSEMSVLDADAVRR